MNYSEVNWKQLFAWLNEVLGTNVEFQIDLSGKRPQIVSPNLFGDSGIFKAVVSEIEVGFFGFWETKDENDQVVGFSGTVNLSYQAWSRGSNGMEVGNVWYKSGKWTFESSRVKSQQY